MKTLIVVLLVLAVLILGFLFIHNRASRGSANGTMFTNGGNTWTLGAVTINGTNVPMSNITVNAIQSVPPDTNNTPK